MQLKNLLSLNRIFIIVILLSLNLCVEAQSDKSDYIWLNGYNSIGLNDGNDNFLFDFNLGSSPKGLKGVIPLSFAGYNTSICDKEGNLLLYSNGCHIADSSHTIIENGSGINEGVWIEMIKDSCDDYPGFQDILLLNDPGNENGFYLVHKRIEYCNDEYFDVLSSSHIKKSSSNGSFSVVSKNISHFDSLKVLGSYLTSIRHENNVDWWLTQPAQMENEILVIKLSENGFDIVDRYELPFEYLANTSSSGSARFSPDGSNYSFFNAYNNLVIYDFDRNTGELSNPRQLNLINVPPTAIRFGSAEWAPNSRYLYVSAHEDLWQVDTWEENLEDGVIHIDTYNGIPNPFPTRFFLMALAPDCRIYMNSANGSDSYHVINKPNKKGKDCDFVQQGVQLPYASSNGTLPNFPRYRVDEEDKCDPTITSIFGEDIYWRRDLSCHPNPVQDQLTVELPEQKKGKLVVLDMEGQIVLTQEVLSGSQMTQVSLGGLPAGAYSVEFFPDENRERRIWTSKVVKID